MNKIDNLNNPQLNSYARLLAAEAALAAGAPESALMILAKTIEVHARRSGSWQVSLPGASERAAAVVFADMTGKRVSFHVVPAGWLRADVTRRHAEAYPTGHRVNNDDSPHSAVELDHIAQWGPDWRAYIAVGEGTRRCLS
jgi:hypothetical protein